MYKIWIYDPLHHIEEHLFISKGNISNISWSAHIIEDTPHLYATTHCTAHIIQIAQETSHHTLTTLANTRSKDNTLYSTHHSNRTRNITPHSNPPHQHPLHHRRTIELKTKPPCSNTHQIHDIQHTTRKHEIRNQHKSIFSASKESQRNHPWLIGLPLASWLSRKSESRHDKV